MSQPAKIHQKITVFLFIMLAIILWSTVPAYAGCGDGQAWPKLSSCNDYLYKGAAWYSQNQKTYLRYQEDGNLVLYWTNPKGTAVALWSTNTTNTQNQSAWRTYLQPDGNLVVYAEGIGSHPVAWASNTSKASHPEFVELWIYDNGNMMIRYTNHSSMDTVLWSAADQLNYCKDCLTRAY